MDSANGVNLISKAAAADDLYAAKNHHRDYLQPPDQVEISYIPALSQVALLQDADEAAGQRVVANAVRELKAAALQASNPLDASYLISLVHKFQALGRIAPQEAAVI